MATICRLVMLSSGGPSRSFDHDTNDGEMVVPATLKDNPPPPAFLDGNDDGQSMSTKWIPTIHGETGGETGLGHTYLFTMVATAAYSAM